MPKYPRVGLGESMTMGSRLLQIGTTHNPNSLFFSKGVDQEIFPGRPMGVDSVRAKINHPLMMMMNEFKALAMCVC